MQVPRDLLGRAVVVAFTRSSDAGGGATGSDRGPGWTAEQLLAIERRSGDLLLDASAGSGKTSVLVERFARAVIEDGVDVGAILTITFTEKAAAELRDRIRARLRELGAVEAARETEVAFISTIHGFCARVLRAHALAAGLDPQFAVLDEAQARQLADVAFDEALEDLAENVPGAIDLIAAHSPATLRAAIVAVYEQLRSRGQVRPTLPPLPSAAAAEDEDLTVELQRAAAGAAAELGAIRNPAVRVVQALERLDRCETVLTAADPWPGELDALAMPQGNGAALSTPVVQDYVEALARFRAACERRRAEQAHALLDRLLQSFSARYEALKRGGSGVDFEDLELLCRELLADGSELRERYRARFEHVMVDELQDTNQVQLELIESISRGNLFTVGDAQQSIYGFRHADVELFEARGRRLEEVGARATLQTNFRSRPEILGAINRAFSTELGERFRPLRAGREAGPPAAEPLVELLIADKAADWGTDNLSSPWRIAEARALARRVGELVSAGTAPGEIVVLTRATTDLRAYERALEDAGIPTYVIGGRGYWAHPQVIELVAYLRALANPRDEEALYTVLASPLVGASLDALVVVGAAARTASRDPWWVLREPEGRLDELGEDEVARLAGFAGWFAAERELALRAGVEELIERVLELTDYDLHVLALRGGERRLANVRKLMRLGREHEAVAGRDLRGFLELVRARAGGWGGALGSRESEAPVEGEALDAVRLMTIHRAKGLEFESVCVADLGRGPLWRAELMRVGRDGRFGVRLAEPGTGKREPALDYRALGEEQQRFEEEEERRLFYVAMTRARERLILSGAARLDPWPANGGAGPIAWIAPAFVPDIAERVGETSSVTEDRVAVRISRDDAGAGGPSMVAPSSGEAEAVLDVAPPAPVPLQPPAPPVSRLSYSSLGEYRRCGYRFYAERVLRLPGVEAFVAAPETGEPGLSAIDRGTLAHELLEKLDFRRPVPPSAAAIMQAARGSVGSDDAEEIAALIGSFAASELCARLGRATDVRREERFAFLLPDGLLMSGVLDVLARESEPAHPDRLLVVDYKSDRLEGADPATIVEASYATQRLVYGLAALRAGAATVDVAHVFLEVPDAPVLATFTTADAGRLEAELAELAGGVLRREFRVTDTPHRAICAGCPAEGGLCSWPLEMTRREAPDRLF